MEFLQTHENRQGKVGEFVRSCIMVAERSALMTRSELKESAHMGYLLDCFAVIPDDDDEDESC